jgi:hypothetical protein
MQDVMVVSIILAIMLGIIIAGAIDIFNQLKKF